MVQYSWYFFNRLIIINFNVKCRIISFYHKFIHFYYHCITLIYAWIIFYLLYTNENNKDISYFIHIISYINIYTINNKQSVITSHSIFDIFINFNTSKFLQFCMSCLNCESIIVINLCSSNFL